MDYPFLNYMKEDKSRYKTAVEAGYIDPDGLFLVGDSGGFLLNINYDDKFINTELFSPAAAYFKEHKKFTPFKEDSLPHIRFRKQEERRRKYGYTAPCLKKANGEIVDVRITGSHYNFLNYTLIKQLDTDSVDDTAGGATGTKHVDFSKFFDSQFWIFHIMEFCKNNGLHSILCKTRRGGLSYIEAADSANEINLNPDTIVIHVAADSKYLVKKGGLTDFTTSNLQVYEDLTPFKRHVDKRSAEDFRLGFRHPSGVESPESWGSSLLSVSANSNPDCAIGKDAKKIKVEELSTMVNFDEFLSVTEPTMRTGSYTTGMLSAWGTATSGDMSVFEQNFYNPKANHFMAFENVWDDNARSEVCGFFKSFAWGLQGTMDGEDAMDEFGNSNVEVALKIAMAEREVKKNEAKTYDEFINFKGQYALYPSESFSSSGDNIFSSEELNAWSDILRVSNDYNFYTDGMLFDNMGVISWKTNKLIRAEGKKAYDYITSVPRKAGQDPHGCIRIWTPPKKQYVNNPGTILDTQVYKSLYSISYDPVGVDKDKKEVTLRHSHNSITVWENPNSTNGHIPLMVAKYYGRPDTLEEADRICYMLARYYNCIGTTCIETNRGESVPNFRKWGALKYLSREPLGVWDTSLKTKFATNYGYNMGSEQKKMAGLRLLKEMLYQEVGTNDITNEPIRLFHKIYDYPTIIELIKYNSTGNFDRVSEMIVKAIEQKYYSILQDTLITRNSNTAKESSLEKRPWF